MRRRLVILSWLAALTTAPLGAAVVNSEAGGFQLAFEASTTRPPEDVFAGFSDVGSWWNPEHSFSGRAENLSLDPRPRGCFCETVEGGGIVHLEVIHAAPPKRLVLRGGLGPLQELPVTGTMVWTLEPGEGGGTRIRLSYGVSGSVSGGLTDWAPAVDGVIGEQLARFVLWLETGSAGEAEESAGGDS